LTLRDLIVDAEVILNGQDESWYEAYGILYEKKKSEFLQCIKLKMNMKKLFEFKIPLKKITDHINSEYDDLFCIFSPDSIGQINVFVNTNNIVLPNEDSFLFLNESNKEEIYLEECVIPILEKENIVGIRGINEIFFIRENDEWIIETNGINSRKISSNYKNFKKLLALDIVNEFRTISNNVWDIYEVLGIEAAREFLIEEFKSIMNDINICHIKLLVDRMTYGGSIASITRYTMKKDDSGPFGRASFEETMDNFLNAASCGEIEPTNGVSASIICGKRANIGTGLTNIKVDLTKLPTAQTLDLDQN